MNRVFRDFRRHNEKFNRFKSMYGGSPYIPENQGCTSRREGEEWVCPGCGLRWEAGEERPVCLKGNTNVE